MCVWQREEGKNMMLNYQCTMIILLNVSFSLFQTNKGALLDVLFKGDELFFFSKRILRGAHFLDVSSQDDNTVKYICVILGIFIGSIL